MGLRKNKIVTGINDEPVTIFMNIMQIFAKRYWQKAENVRCSKSDIQI